MFELRVALRRDSGLISNPAWVGWAPLCPALAAEDGLVVWARPDTPTSDVEALRDCALYADRWAVLRRVSQSRGTEVVRLEGAHRPMAIARRAHRFGAGRGRASRVEREIRAMAESEVETAGSPDRAIGWIEERRRGRVVREYAVSVLRSSA